MITYLFILFQIAFASQADASCNDRTVKLHIEEQLVYEAGQPYDLKATVSNIGNRPVTLVQPGDGSETRRRTPFYRWEVIESPAAADPRTLVPMPICGNINALRPGEVFALRPGETVGLGSWISLGLLRAPGTYRFKLYLENDPKLVWSGVPLGTHDEVEMARVHESTPCKLESNELTLIVH